jgi:hypothetical protein
VTVAIGIETKQSKVPPNQAQLLIGYHSPT